MGMILNINIFQNHNNIYAPQRRVEKSSEGINGWYLRNAKLFEGIELSVAVKRIYVNKSDTYSLKK